MKLKKAFFTTKTALGDTFCNREAERELLKNYVEKGEHTVIVAPRRFGKTSLVCQTLAELQVDAAKIDLFCVLYAATICEKITQAVSELIKKLIPFSTKTLKFIESCFKHINIVLKAGKFELQVNLAQSQVNPVQQIIDVLTGLEKIAQHQKKRIVVFIDEFQDLLKADYSDEIQAAIRSVAQHAQYTSFIFSGSSRDMLRYIFEDRNQPLYMLCQKIHLKKIAPENLAKHMQHAAQKQWQKALPEAVVEKILTLTECHPYYLNLLCVRLWNLSTLPNVKNIDAAWLTCLTEHKDKLIADLDPLNATRIKILSKLALSDGTSAPQGKEFLELVGLPLGTMQKAVQYLTDNDFIYYDEISGKTNLVDPLLKLFLADRTGN